MGFTSVDQIAPYVRDIQIALGNYPNLPQTFKGTPIIEKWMTILHGKNASDELIDSELRQLKFDVEGVMNNFNDFLGGR